MATCKKCGAPMIWAKTIPGMKSIPLDPEPTPNGNVLLFANEETGTPFARVLSGDELEVERQYKPLRTSHFATCPDANHFRR